MSSLTSLEFVATIPRDLAFPAHSPLERARAKFIHEIDIQIKLAKNPELILTRTVKRRDGQDSELVRKPRSWVTRADGFSYITVRISNKPVDIGGGRGGVIKCPEAKTVSTLQTIKDWASSSDADGLIGEMVEKSKRGKRISRRKAN